jgi:signal peptidase I
MKVLLESFERLNAKYQKKYEHFKQRIERFKSKNQDALYKKSSQLLNEADALIRELKSDFLVTAEGQVSETTIKQKMKALKGCYKELNEITKSQLRQWVEAIVIALGLALVLRNFVFGLYHVPTGSAEPNILVGDRIWGNKMAYFFSDVKRGDLVIFDNPTFDYDRSSSIHYLWQRYVGFPIPLLGLGVGPDNWVKRVIAVPGDVIEGRLEDGRTVVYVNNKKLDEPYVNHYPLIAVRKDHGLIPFANIGIFNVPSFLRYETRISHYTYDPSKSFADQPFYTMTEDDIVKRPDSTEPILLQPYSPTYDLRSHICMDVFGPYTIPEGKYWAMGDSRKNSQDSRWWGFLDQELVHGRASFIIYSIDSEEAFWLFDLIKHPVDFWTKHIRFSRFFKGLNGYKVES